MDERLDEISRAVWGLKPGEVPAAVEAALAAGIDARTVLTDGLAAGMRVVGEKYAAAEYFIPEVLVASKGMYSGMEILKPRLASGVGGLGTAVLGVVKGDRHDIGKNVVKALLESAGFDVVDLGRNVPREKFVEALRESKAGILGLSTLMTTTMPEMAAVVSAVRDAPDLKHVAVLVGGAPISQAFSEKIGAHGYGRDAAAAVELARSASANAKP